MGQLTEQIAIVMGVLFTCFAGPAAAVYFLILRKTKARKRRRSAIGISLLRGPGHSLREQIDRLYEELAWDHAQLMLVPLLALAMFLAQGHVAGLPRIAHLAPVYAAAVVAFIAFMVRKLVKASTRLDHLRSGYDAEVAVGQELDQSMREGAVTFHDLPGEQFNIDHVVIATRGVFAVETKGFTKLNRGRGRADATVFCDGETLRFPTWTIREPLEQAERQANWLAKFLSSAVGSPVSVQPVVALPGWFVDRRARGRVHVFSGKELAGLLKPCNPTSLTDEEVRRIAHQVEQRCRSVAPLYGPLPGTS